MPTVEVQNKSWMNGSGQALPATRELSAATCTSTVVMGEVGGQDFEHPDACICFFKSGAFQINLRSGVKRPVRRLELLFGSKVYKIGTLDLEAA